MPSQIIQQQILELAEQHAVINSAGTKEYPEHICEKMNALDSRVIMHTIVDDFHCHWVAPYGFVPEAGCPHHD